MKDRNKMYLKKRKTIFLKNDQLRGIPIRYLKNSFIISNVHHRIFQFVKRSRALGKQILSDEKKYVNVGKHLIKLSLAATVE